MKQIFPNLNTLRCIAASLVIIHHVETYKHLFGYASYIDIPFFEIIGKLGVVLFFVLSGFLITSLLLSEQERKGTISLRNFYIRRILRIWPLYYVIVLMGFYVYPYLPFFDIPDHNIFPDVLENRVPNIFYYMGIFANLGWAIYNDVPYTSQSWSLATEEQFYLFWPLLILLFRKRLITMMLGILIVYWSIQHFIDSKAATEIFQICELNILKKFWYSFNINCMAIGGIFAVATHRKSLVLQLIYNKYFFIFITIAAGLFLLKGVTFTHFHYDIYALLFAVIIVNLACNTRWETILENPVLSYIGSISYGMYMLHLPVLVIAIKTGIYFGSFFLLPYLITFGGTVLLAHLSYQYFECYFLRLKSRFT